MRNMTKREREGRREKSERAYFVRNEGMYEEDERAEAECRQIDFHRSALREKGEEREDVI